jgi:Arc/MetJ family transcription regulator
MATNLALDDKLIERARLVGGYRTKKAAVTAALEEFVNRHERLKLMDLFGGVDYDPDYDYKAARRREAPR